jgi:outer membrane protein assembly factor BamB/actin-like ATPase involved in cell morphogenesis
VSGYGLGVDLGTTHTAAAVLVGGRVELIRLGNRRPEIPSLVFVTDSAVLVGDAAERRGAAEPERLAREFKRRLGDPVPLLVGGSPYPAHALMAKLLRRVYDIARSQYDEPPSAITVTHPANWGPFKRELLDQAIWLADIANVRFLPEPEAAAIHYATTERVRPGETVAVYDLGGGTFDAAVLRRTATGFELLGRSEGIEQLGGIDFDEAVFAHVLATIGDSAQTLDPDDELVTTALARLRRDCTEAKESLSFDTEVMIPVALPGLHTRVRLNRSEFEAMIGPALAETVTATARALRAAGVSPSDLRSVVLAGGSSRIPLVSQLLDAEFGRPVTLDPHPEHSVAMGAAATTGPLALGAAPARPAFTPSASAGGAGVAGGPAGAGGGGGAPGRGGAAAPPPVRPAATGPAGRAAASRATPAYGPVPRPDVPGRATVAGGTGGAFAGGAGAEGGAGGAFAGAEGGAFAGGAAAARGASGAGRGGAPDPPASAPGADQAAPFSSDPDSTTQLPPATDPDSTSLLPAATDAAPADAMATSSPPATPPSQPSSGRTPPATHPNSRGTTPPQPASAPPATPASAAGASAWPATPPPTRQPSAPAARPSSAPPATPASAPPAGPSSAAGAPAWPPVPPTWRGAATPTSGAPSGTGTAPARTPSGPGSGEGRGGTGTPSGGGRPGAARPADQRPGSAGAEREGAVAAPRGATASPVHVNRAVAPPRPPSGPTPALPGTARPSTTPDRPPPLAALGRRLAGLRGRRLWLVAGLVGVILIAIPVAVLAWPRDEPPTDDATGGTTTSTTAPAPAVPGKPSHLWSYDVGSPASGRPAVAGDTVYVGDQGGKVHAIDRATGRDRWRYDAGSPVNASPQVRDGVVYIASQDGMLHAIGATDGARRWRVPAGSGSTSSPVVTADAVYVGGADGLYAFRLSGQQRWRFSEGGAVTTTPAVSGDTVFASGGNGRAYAVDAGSGSRRWSASIGDGLSAPVVAGGLLYVGSAGRLVHALDAGSGKVRWTFPATGAVTTAPLPDADTVYFGASDGLVYSVNAADGGLRWRYTIEGGQPVSASPSLADRVLYVGSGAGMLYALEAASGAPLWQFTTEGTVAGITLADKVLYAAGGNRVYALQPPTA